MKKLFFLPLLFSLTGCLTDPFYASGGAGGGTGGELNGGGGTGGISFTSSTTNSTSDTTTSSTSSMTMPEFTNMPVSDCVGDYVFVPWSGYDLIGSPAVSCITVPVGKDYLVIKDFTYNLFKGQSLNNMLDCDATDHPTIWFTTSLDPSGEIIIPKEVNLQEKQVSVGQLVWTDFVTSDFNGMVAPVTVVLDNMVTIFSDQMFCFGHRFVASVSGNPTCLHSCLNDASYENHQLSDSKSNPYNFNPANSWPPDGDTSKHYSFVASVTGGVI